MNKLRWGILGVAKINDRLLPAFAKAANAELRAIASRSLDKAQAAAKAAGIPQAYGSYEALLDDPNIDAVYNPAAQHPARRVDQEGRRARQARPVREAADADRGRGPAKLVDFCRAQEGLPHGRLHVAAPSAHGASCGSSSTTGKIGEVRRVTGAFTFRMAKLDPANIRLQARARRRQPARRRLLSRLRHPLGLGRGAGPRLGDGAHTSTACDVEMTGTLWFADGRIATFDCGFTHPLRQWLEITGTTGVRPRARHVAAAASGPSSRSGATAATTPRSSPSRATTRSSTCSRTSAAPCWKASR